MSDARTRLMLVRAYLLDNTDEWHAVSLRNLCASLERAGIAADTRAVLADIRVLKESGLDVRSQRGRARTYYVGARSFEPAELRLLADMVQASRLLTQARTDALLEKLARQASRYETERFPVRARRQNPLKAQNDEAFLNIERILAAQRSGKKLSFIYCEYSQKKTLHPRRGGQAYVVNPCMLLYAEERYYLVADHPAHEGFAHYRLDKMRSVCVLEDLAAPLDGSFDPAAYARTLFSMYPAEQRWVRLAFDRALVGAMIDRFGQDAPMQQLDTQTYSLYAPVRVGAPFFGWVFQFCGGVRILAPDDIRERMLLMLEAARRSNRAEKPNNLE